MIKFNRFVHSENYLFFVILLVVSCYYVYVIIDAPNTYDYGDGIQHYLMSRYSWKHPELLLDLWGKPLFTLLSAPFAQYGLKGIAFFQLLCAIFTSLLSFKIIQILKLQYAYLIPIFIFFSPIYFSVLNSGLTEIFFSFIMILVLFFYLRENFIIASLIYSFSIFSRPEAYFIYPLIITYLLLKKQWKSIPFLFVGFILMSIIGYFYYNDILWIINNNYQVSQNYPQKGELWHYLKNYKNIWGETHFILFSIGLSSLIYEILKNKQVKYKEEKLLLLSGSIITIFTLHTLMNYLPGLHSNLGMLRFFSSIIPISGIIAVHGLNFLTTTLKSIPFSENIVTSLKNFLIILLSISIIYAPFQTFMYPFKLSNEQIVINQISSFIKNSPFHNKKICYLHPQLPVSLNFDPFDTSASTLLWSFNINELSNYKDSTIILWDSHFAPVEGNLPLNKLLEHKNIYPLRCYRYADSTQPFETWLFFIHSGQLEKNIPEPVLLTETSIINKQKADSIYYDFDNFTVDKKYLSDKKSYSGNHSLEFKNTDEWGYVFSKNAHLSSNNITAIKIKFKYLPVEHLNEVLLVVHIVDKNDKTIDWWGQKIKTKTLNQWNNIEFMKTVDLTKLKQTEYTINVYFWNKSKNNFYIDDILIHYYYKN